MELSRRQLVVRNYMLKIKKKQNKTKTDTLRKRKITVTFRSAFRAQKHVNHIHILKTCFIQEEMVTQNCG